MVHVVGAGFAGVEAAWALASRGVHVQLHEMRPDETTPAHTTGYFAELVCSNSLKSRAPISPAGQLKAEMRALGSIVLECADECSVPAGEALGVDRDKFGELITERIGVHPQIDVVHGHVTPSEIQMWIGQGDSVILATGPLTTPDLAEWLAQLTGRSHLYFYDAVSPTVDAATIDLSIAFAQSRYDKGEGADYINCPFSADEYYAFVEALVTAERAPIHAFEAGGKRDLPEGETVEDAFLEKIKYFAGCMPIEAIADKGARSLAFGNFKPVGLTDPRTGRRPYAALQLRPENREKTLYSLVACQTRLKWGEQKRVFRMVPGLQNAEFVRFGVIHRNTYLEAPAVLAHDLQLKSMPNLYVAGQLTGVEGYVESAAMGILVGLNIYRKQRSLGFSAPPRETAYGSLLSHLGDQTAREFAPMNINWGLLPEPEIPADVPRKIIKDVKREQKILTAQSSFQSWLTALQ